MLTKEIKINILLHVDVLPNLNPLTFSRWQQETIKRAVPREEVGEFRPIREKPGGAKLQSLAGKKQQKRLKMYFRIKRLGNLEDGL